MLKPNPGIAALTLQPGDVVFGRYRITGVLSQQAAVAGAPSGSYSAIDLTSGAKEHAAVHKVVTLRLLPSRGSAGEVYELSDDEQAHFSQQARQLGGVQHPAVARTYTLTLQAELGVLLAREPVEPEGQTLRDVLAVRGGPLPESEAIQLCAQIGEALEAAHQHGACHLGLSPACVFVFPDGAGVRVKVADFGLLPPAWAARVGEPGYLAPEQAGYVVGDKPDAKLDGLSCDRRTDQFALAVILYEMLAGQPAFIAAASEDRQVILGRVRNEDPLPLSQSRAVEQALARALSRSRGVRFPSVRDFVQALGADVSGWPAGPAAAAVAGPAPRARTPRLVLPMAAGAIFSLAALGAVMVVRQVTKPPRATYHDLRDLESAGRAGLTVDVDLAPGPDLVAAVTGSSDGGELAATDAGGALAAAGDAGVPVPGRTRPVELGVVKPEGVNPVAATPSSTQPAPVLGMLPLSFGGPEIQLLTSEQRAELTSCVRMISPRPPFRVVIQNISGTLYVDSNQTSPELSSSQDFRDCLKLRVKGNIVPKVVTITRMSKGKAPQ